MFNIMEIKNMNNKNEIRFKINAVDNARTRAINYVLAFGLVLLTGLVAIKLIISLIIGG